MSGLQTSKSKLRDFLFRMVNKEFLVFVFFLVISGIFWLVLAIKEPMEKEILIPVNIANVPQNVVITDGGSDTIRVTVRDNGYTIVGYYFQGMSPLTMSFDEFDKGDGHCQMPASRVIKEVKARLERSTQVVSIKPEKLDVYYNYGDCKVVPVEIHGKITAESKSFIVSRKAKPDSVTIYASSEQLKQITSVKTQFINMTDVSDVQKRTVKLQRESGVKCVPEVVEVEVRADILTEGSIEVPIVPVGVPDEKRIRTFPSTVTVNYVTGANLLSQVEASQFKVEVRYDEIDDSLKTRFLTLHLVGAPQFVSRARLASGSVDYLVEQR